MRLRGIDPEGMKRLAGTVKVAQAGTYEGWKNQTTWSIALNLNNDYGLKSFWDEQAEAALEFADGDKEDALFALAENLEQSFREEVEQANLQGALSDILNNALNEVDWADIADSLLPEGEMISMGEPRF
jgi:hypothetical protein